MLAIPYSAFSYSFCITTSMHGNGVFLGWMVVPDVVCKGHEPGVGMIENTHIGYANGDGRAFMFQFALAAEGIYSPQYRHGCPFPVTRLQYWEFPLYLGRD
jgi:hypothetical protein